MHLQVGGGRAYTASSLPISPDGTPSATIIAYGRLLCTAAYACAQKGDRAAALQLLAEADIAADRLDDAVPLASAFNHTNVTIYRIGIANALGESAAALDSAQQVQPGQLPTIERYARYCIDTARAWDLHGNTDRAYQALLTAERRAPQELRRPSVRTFVSTLLYTPGRPPAGLRDLAVRVGASQ
jgi:tetratricopeptide (TPR) repeat protein